MARTRMTRAPVFARIARAGTRPVAVSNKGENEVAQNDVPYVNTELLESRIREAITDVLKSEEFVKMVQLIAGAITKVLVPELKKCFDKRRPNTEGNEEVEATAALPNENLEKVDSTRTKKVQNLERESKRNVVIGQPAEETTKSETIKSFDTNEMTDSDLENKKDLISLTDSDLEDMSVQDLTDSDLADKKDLSSTDSDQGHKRVGNLADLDLGDFRHADGAKNRKKRGARCRRQTCQEDSMEIIILPIVLSNPNRGTKIPLMAKVGKLEDRAIPTEEQLSGFCNYVLKSFTEPQFVMSTHPCVLVNIKKGKQEDNPYGIEWLFDTNRQGFSIDICSYSGLKPYEFNLYPENWDVHLKMPFLQPQFTNSYPPLAI